MAHKQRKTGPASRPMAGQAPAAGDAGFEPAELPEEGQQQTDRTPATRSAPIGRPIGDAEYAALKRRAATGRGASGDSGPTANAQEEP